MQSQGQEIVTGSCQAGLGLAQLGIIERDELRVRKEEDPWQKSCVLSLGIYPSRALREVD